MDLVITPTGGITTLYTEALDLSPLGPATITRASQVEPDATGCWWARIRSGPTLGPFAKRSLALAAEIAWLTERQFFLPLP